MAGKFVDKRKKIKLKLSFPQLETYRREMKTRYLREIKQLKCVLGRLSLPFERKRQKDGN